MDGMSADAIAALVDGWLEELFDPYGYAQPTKPAKIKGKLPRHETREYRTTHDHVQYHIKPLVLGRDLFKEGKLLRQGIFAHLQEILDHRILVYSLRIVKGDKVERLLTIELAGADTMENRFRLRDATNKRTRQLPRELRVVQVRGTADRDPTSLEIDIIRTWAWENKLEWTPPLIPKRSTSAPS
jgi:hypothetical protein